MMECSHFVMLIPDDLVVELAFVQIYEHEAMHLETLMYMLVQMRSVNLPPSFTPPDWVSLSHGWDLEAEIHKAEKDEVIEYSKPTLLKVGHEDSDKDDDHLEFSEDHEFGWDNEHPARMETVGAFKLSPKPISNHDYLNFLLAFTSESSSLEEKDVPASWIYTFNSQTGSHAPHQIQVRTIYGPVPFPVAQHWPVQASGRQLAAFAQFRGGRLPSANELRVHFRDNAVGGPMSPIGFRHWHPVPAQAGRIEADGVWRGAMNGGVWEWTSSIFDQFEGFESSKIYEGYSRDFFDGSHWVVLGASWATLPRIAHRKSFV